MHAADVVVLKSPNSILIGITYVVGGGDCSNGDLGGRHCSFAPERLAA